MSLQAFVDDSGGKGQGRLFVMVGLVGHSEDWAIFTDEWRACLGEGPTLQYFKMSEAASCGGQFFGWSPKNRDAKLRQLARIINRHAKLVTYSAIDLVAHAELWAKLDKPHNDPYFWPFHTTLMAVCHSLRDSGWRESFDAIFDEQVIFGPRARAWYPVLREVFRVEQPEAFPLLPVDVMFGNDIAFPPIQAADLYAWCFRRGSILQENRPFDWLLEELGNVSLSKYSQYYDRERMAAVHADSLTPESMKLAKQYALKFRPP